MMDYNLIVNFTAATFLLLDFSRVTFFLFCATASQGNFDGTSTSPPIRVSDENVGSNASYPIEEDIPVSMQITGQDDKCMLYFCVIVVVKYCPSYSIQE